MNVPDVSYAWGADVCGTHELKGVPGEWRLFAVR